MAFTVLVYQPLGAIAAGIIQKSGINIEFVIPKTADEAGVCEAIEQCDAFLVDSLHKAPFVGKTIIDAGKNLKMIIAEAIGYDFIDAEYATQKGIYVVNGAGASTVAVAEATMLLMLGCVRNAHRVGARFNRLRKDYPFFEFNDPLTKSVELRGKTLGLLGCGAIGREVAGMAHYGFGMRVIGHDPYLPQFPDHIERCGERQALFAESDFVSLHLPSLPETRGSIGMPEFLLMKPSAYFINASRGDIVREQELIEALRTGVIKGAGLDVYEKEPICEESYALFDMDFVFLMPHNAASCIEAGNRYEEFKAYSILEGAKGQLPTRRVNKPNSPRLQTA